MDNFVTRNILLKKGIIVVWGKFIGTVNVIAIVTHWIYNGTLKIAKIGKFSCFSFLKLIEARTGK